LIADVPFFIQLELQLPDLLWEANSYIHLHYRIERGKKASFYSICVMRAVWQKRELCDVSCVTKAHVRHCCSEQCYTEFTENPRPIHLNASNLQGPDFISSLKIIQIAFKNMCRTFELKCDFERSPGLLKQSLWIWAGHRHNCVATVHIPWP